jgi:hypothetical protein
MIGIGYFNMWLTRNAPCPIDPRLAQACKTGKRVSLILLIVSTVLLMVGSVFAFLL